MNQKKKIVSESSINSSEKWHRPWTAIKFALFSRFWGGSDRMHILIARVPGEFLIKLFTSENRKFRPHNVSQKRNGSLSLTFFSSLFLAAWVINPSSSARAASDSEIEKGEISLFVLNPSRHPNCHKKSGREGREGGFLPPPPFHRLNLGENLIGKEGGKWGKSMLAISCSSPSVWSYYD